MRVHHTFRAAVFDLDGVLVDTARFHYLAWRQIALDLGFDFSEQHNERLKGVSRLRSLEIVLEVGGLSLSADAMTLLAERKNRIYVDSLSDISPRSLLPGARELLEVLQRAGVKIALGSASKNARIILGKTSIERYFDAVVDGYSVSNPKPDPEVFLRGSALVGVKAASCLVFEDSTAGVEAANAAGMGVVGVGDAATLSSAGLIVADLKDSRILPLFSLQ